METSGGADRIAVMIDADNTRAAYANEVLSEVAKYGNPTIRRVYGDWTNPHLSRWARILNSLGLRAMHQNAYTSGKNSTDLALVIDAMDLLYDGNVEAFALVTSDSDFTSLAHRLRESGKTVYVLGENKAPESLRNACDKFIDLAVVAETHDEDDAEDDADDTDPRETPSVAINLQSALTRAVNAVSDDEGWASLPALGNQLIRTHPSFDARNFAGPGARLSTLVSAQPYLETSGSGNAMRVRLKGSAPRQQAKGRQPAQKSTAPKSTAQKSAAKAPAKAPAKAAAADAPTEAPDKPVVKKTVRRTTTRKPASQD
ncbi:NYN domain-containing protein [Microbacterium sp. ARD31]|jgi:uncharacterized protein (TIGR00288 family)|uniref:NYN domain-containing protein n=1 Tax=Microbacterium sp. ARD31 TaxID=2962576 RepID=UPI0028824F5B|nr:NYN domain-containing protein [Microbacterium sp. ARD31]MDT0185387.1 NYN domain-containing protein [Microbacterium sp. ARD31]